jgi:hypothetical protein
MAATTPRYVASGTNSDQLRPSSQERTWMTGVLLQQGLPCNEAHLDHRRLGTGPVDIPAAAGGIQPHLGSSLSRPSRKDALIGRTCSLSSLCHVVDPM